MKNTSSRKLLFTTIAIVFLALLSAIIINLFTAKKDVADWLEKVELKYLVGGLIIIGFASILFAYFQHKYAEKAEKEKEISTEDIEPDVKKLFDSLKERYQNRYESKLDERFEITLEVSEDWDGHKTQTFNERYDKDAKISKAFPKIKNLLEKKDGLLIVGEPGAGKTVLLLKVALNLLAKTNLSEKEAFPVIFNLASWSDEHKDFGEWLKAMLVSGNGLSKDFAARLLHEKRFIFLLDGLDELARNEDKSKADKKRAACLKALNKYLDGEKNVICCRIDEFVEMQKNTAQDAPVSAKVEVLNLTEAEVLNELEKAQNHQDPKYHASAKNLIQLFVKEENKALRKVLCTPFYFTIALEVFYERDFKPEEINLPKDEKSLETYLTEKYIERKLEKTPNPNSFDKMETMKWLKWLAQLMEKKQLITFELADLQPTDLIKRWHYNLLYSLIGGLVGGLFFGLFYGLVIGLVIGLVVGLIGGLSRGLFRGLSRGLFRAIVVGLVVGLFFGLDAGLYYGLYYGFFGALFFSLFRGLFRSLVVGLFGDTISTEDLINLNFSRLLTWNYWKGILHCLLPSFFVSLVVGLDAGLYYGFFGGLFYGLVIVLVIGLENLKEIKRVTYLKNPYQRIYGGFFVNFLLACAVFPLLVMGFIFLSYVEDNDTFKHLKTGITLTVLASLTQIIKMTLLRHSVLRLALFFEGVIPLSYATFLDYAASLRILEKDGGQWRFRHQNLQEYFARLDMREDLTTK